MSVACSCIDKALQVAYGKRAHAAMNNHAEQFQFFAVAAVLSLLFTPDSLLVAIVSLIIAAARILHVVFYVADMAAFRSLSFFVSGAGVLVLFINCLAHF